MNRPRNLKEWNLFRLGSGKVLPAPDLETLYNFYDEYPDICLICAGAGEVGRGMITPAGIIVEFGPCPACYGEGVCGWYSVN